MGTTEETHAQRRKAQSAGVLLVLWLFGLVSSYTLGGFIHLLLVIAVVVLVIQLIQGRRTPPL